MYFFNFLDKKLRVIFQSFGLFYCCFVFDIVGQFSELFYEVEFEGGIFGCCDK